MSGPCSTWQVLLQISLWAQPVVWHHGRFAWTTRYGGTTSVITRQSELFSLCQISLSSVAVISIHAAGPAALAPPAPPPF